MVTFWIDLSDRIVCLSKTQTPAAKFYLFTTGNFITFPSYAVIAVAFLIPGSQI
jgi:hypothetical protein